MADLRVLIVDDEEPGRRKLRRMLEAEPGVAVVGEAENGAVAIDRIRELEPDLVLLDIQMPRMDGFAVVDAIGADRMPEVIFVTAHDQYAVRAFEISAVDYLLKPVTEARFRMAFARAKRRLGAGPAADSSRQILAALDAIAGLDRHLKRLAVREGQKTIFVPIDDVEWIEALQNYVRLHVGRATYLLHVPMSTLEAALDPARFVRIHRSHIVNVQRIRQMWSLSHGQYVVELTSGPRLQTGRTYGETIRRLLSNPF